MLKVYNTYTLEKEPFVPLEEGQIKMYVCGPTVYNYIHLGNARSAIAFDTIRRYLEYRGFQVDYVSNFTDLGDKIIVQAKKEGLSEQALAEKYEAAFDEDTARLNIKPATVRSKATEVMPDIITFVKKLVADGIAYESDGDVYFRARKFPNYGVLSHQDLDEMEENAAGRLDDEEALRKEDPIDFALWKGEKRAGVIAWDSPWGLGRPGWHIECSVMADKYLGDSIDIHGGGIDLAFPHHTNEIAQSESYHHKRFVRYWMHNGFVNVNQEKMSKSLGNFTTVHELLAQYDDAETIRYFLGKTHYRRPINYTADSLQQAQIELDRMRRAYHRLKSHLNQNTAAQNSNSLEAEMGRNLAVQEFETAMDDDFNSENALKAIFLLVKVMNKYTDNRNFHPETTQNLIDTFTQLVSIFGIIRLDDAQVNKEIEDLLKARITARNRKDYAASDRLRDELKTMGILVRDTAQGQEWEKV